MALLLVLLLFAALVNVVIDTIIILTVTRFSRAEEYFQRVYAEYPQLHGSPEYGAIAAWAGANNFEPDIAADFSGGVGTGPIRMLIWRNTFRKTYLSAYEVPEKLCWSFVTTLDRDSSLETTNSKDGLLFPSAPGSFQQAFDNADLDTLYRYHEEGLLFLHDRKGLSIVDRQRPTEELVLESMHRQVDHVKGILLWQFRGPYWYFIRRNAVSNKSVEKRYPD